MELQAQQLLNATSAVHLLWKDLITKWSMECSDSESSLKQDLKDLEEEVESLLAMKSSVTNSEQAVSFDRQQEKIEQHFALMKSRIDAAAASRAQELRRLRDSQIVVYEPPAAPWEKYEGPFSYGVFRFYHERGKGTTGRHKRNTWIAECPFHRAPQSGPCASYEDWMANKSKDKEGRCRKKIEVETDDPQDRELAIRRLKQWCNSALQFDRHRYHGGRRIIWKKEPDPPPMHDLDQSCITQRPVYPVLCDDELDRLAKRKETTAAASRPPDFIQDRWQDDESFKFGWFVFQFTKKKSASLGEWTVMCPCHGLDAHKQACRKSLAVRKEDDPSERTQLCIRRLKAWCNAATLYDRQRHHILHPIDDSPPAMDDLDRDCILEQPRNVRTDETMDAEGRSKYDPVPPDEGENVSDEEEVREAIPAEELNLQRPFPEEPWQRKHKFDYGCFRFCFSANKDNKRKSGGDWGEHGSWIVTCPFHRGEKRRRCEKTLRLKNSSTMASEFCIRQLKTWCQSATAHNRLRFHVPQEITKDPLPMAVLDLECITECPEIVKTDAELDAEFNATLAIEDAKDPRPLAICDGPGAPSSSSSSR